MPSLHATNTVQPAAPINTAGLLPPTGEYNQIDVVLDAGDGISFTATACPSPATFGMALLVPGAVVRASSSGSGCGTITMDHAPRAGTFSLRIYDSGGFTGSYTIQINTLTSFECQATTQIPSGTASAGPIALPFAIPISYRDANGTIVYSGSPNSLWINAAGAVSFLGPLPADAQPASGGVPAAGVPAIYPYWMDVGSYGIGGGTVSYGSGTVNGNPAFCVNWSDITPPAGAPGSSATGSNSFQLYLVDRSDQGTGDYDIIFRYTQLQWETAIPDGQVFAGMNDLTPDISYIGSGDNSADLTGQVIFLGNDGIGSWLRPTSPSLSPWVNTNIQNTSVNSTEPGVIIANYRRAGVCNINSIINDGPPCPY
jgi:hypothetical protein